MSTSTRAGATRRTGPVETGPSRVGRRPPGRPTAVVAVVTVVIAVSAAIVAWLRVPATARETLWAEDGRVFVQQRVADGPVVTWFDPYDGYLHVVPRVLADLAVSWLPVDGLATGVTALACLVAGVVAAAVWTSSRGLVASRAVRVALAAVTVLVPLAPLEVSGNLANLHWYLLWLTPFVLLRRTRGGLDTLVASAAALLVGLTEIQAVVFVPLVVAAHLVRRRWGRGRRRDLVPLVVLGLALVVQLAVAAGTSRAEAPGPPSTLPQIVLGYLSSVVVGTVVPSAGVLGGLLDRGGWLVALVAVVPFVAAAVLVTSRALRRPGAAASTVGGGGDPVALDRLLLTSVASVASVGLWSLGVAVNHGPDTRFWFSDPGRIADLGITRYAVVPSMFLLVVLLCAVDALSGSPSRRSGAVATVLLVVLGALAATWFVGPSPARAEGPRWAGSLGRAEDVCDGGAAVADVAGAPEGWGVLLPCDVVDDAR